MIQEEGGDVREGQVPFLKKKQSRWVGENENKTEMRRKRERRSWRFRCNQKAEGVGFRFLHVGQLLFTCHFVKYEVSHCALVPLYKCKGSVKSIVS